jgi:hypothetical protein
MYQVTALQNATMQKRLGDPHTPDNWKAGDVDYVDDELIHLYQPHTSVFTINQEWNGVLTTGVAAVSGLSATIRGDVVKQVVLTLADVSQSIVNGTEYQGTKLYTFPAGRINVLGVVATLAQKTTSALASTLNASSTGALSLGTATASSTTLNSTMADLLPSTAFTSSATINVAGTAVSNALAAEAQFDGTTTAKDLYLNTAYATTADVDGNATQTISGTITLTYIALGDY